MKTSGRVWKFGDDLNTDYIIAGKYKLSITNLDELSKHTMESIMSDFPEKVKKGDFVVAGKNFGCGSSREQAPLVLKHLGVAAVIAESFARIFYRNAINIGLPAIECNEAYHIKEGELLGVDLTTGCIKNFTKNKTYSIKPFPQELRIILNEGGLVKYFEKHQKLPW